MRHIREESGSVLVEVVGFAVLAFGLIMNQGLNLLDQERTSLELSHLARNAMRSELLHPEGELSSQLAFYQSQSRVLNGERLKVSISCSEPTCKEPGSLMWLTLSLDSLEARAFGVIGG